MIVHTMPRCRSAIEVGDAAAPDDGPLRHAASRRTAPSLKGWYAAKPRDPFDKFTAYAAAPLWRREIDAQRTALWEVLLEVDPPTRSWLGPPPLLCLASGGLAFGAMKHSFELRLAKFLAIVAVARAAEASTPKCHPATNFFVSNAAGDFGTSRALRACLLVIDSFSLRLEIASVAKQRQSDFLAPVQAQNRSLGSERFDSIASRLQASACAQKYYFDDATYLTILGNSLNDGKVDICDLSSLEVAAVASATTAAFSLACVSEHSIPVAMCSLLGARRALWEWQPRHSRHDVRDLLILLDSTLDRFCATFSDLMPRIAFPTIYAPDLQRRIDALAFSGSNGS